MTNRKIHIVSFDVPFPADYGGVIDVFYRIKALSELGFEITLHCFEYGRGQQIELEKYTSTVHYYRRKKSVKDIFKKKPFIVASRESSELLSNLNLDESPILFEGLHTCAFLNHSSLKSRSKMVRTHNIEHDYYSGLANASSGWKKIYFSREAKKLKTFESILAHANHIFAIQEEDVAHFKTINSKVSLLTASTPDMNASIYSTTENYCLYHGNLSILENQQAIFWLSNNVSFPDGVRFIIAGKNPSKEILALNKKKEIEVVANPSDQQMSELIQAARIHLLYTEQGTGLKLKLLTALNSSGHVLVNTTMLEGTSLKPFCQVAENGPSFIKTIAKNISVPLTETKFNERKMMLSYQFNTKKNLGSFVNILDSI